MKLFHSTDILIPKIDMEKWAVIACDQFTSQPQYWETVKLNTEGSFSTLNLILPEAQIDNCSEKKIEEIRDTMYEYLEADIFEEYSDALIYVERTLVNGMVRCGVIGSIDLEEYEYLDDKNSYIRATEQMVKERIPARMIIRENAPIELSHVILLCDDEKDILFSFFTKLKNGFRKLYDFELMEQGGHIVAWLIDENGKKIFFETLERYKNEMKRKYGGDKCKPMYFAVGDGNHSLATAKAYYEKKKERGENISKSRYTMVELENIHSNALGFEPIHRLVTNVDVGELLIELEKEAGKTDGYEVKWYSNNLSGKIHLNKNKHFLAVGVLQNFLDNYLKGKTGKVDYIHDENTVIELSTNKNTIAFVLPEVDKKMLFKSIVLNGPLPRKTFSIGHAVEKRYYVEARRIK